MNHVTPVSITNILKSFVSDFFFSSVTDQKQTLLMLEVTKTDSHVC